MDKETKNNNDLIKSDLKEKRKRNIENIKSKHILEKIFSYINIKTKLSILIYNNSLKKKLSINIENYKKISGYYKIGGKNGNCKLYDLETNNLIFEGEYLNGKKNGKGKEYHINDKLKFEGEYLNGALWNIKGYNIYGELEFEIKNGNGKIREYNCEGKLIYEGEYINGERNGKGIEYEKIRNPFHYCRDVTIRF